MPNPRSIQRTYLVLLLGNTLAASFIWGINTIFLLDAGLSNLEAFAANAFFTAGMVLFEVPTGVVADTVGRRASYLLGTVTLTASTLLYVLLWQVGAPFWAWAGLLPPRQCWPGDSAAYPRLFTNRTRSLEKQTVGPRGW